VFDDNAIQIMETYYQDANDDDAAPSVIDALRAKPVNLDSIIETLGDGVLDQLPPGIDSAESGRTIEEAAAELGMTPQGLVDALIEERLRDVRTFPCNSPLFTSQKTLFYGYGSISPLLQKENYFAVFCCYRYRFLFHFVMKYLHFRALCKKKFTCFLPVIRHRPYP
jgi:hypothetical protein